MILFYKSCLSIFQEQWFNVKQCQCSTFSLSADPWSVQTWPSSSSLTSTLTYFLSQLLSYSKLSFIAPFPHHSSHHSLSPLLTPPHTTPHPSSHHSPSSLLTSPPQPSSHHSFSSLLTPTHTTPHDPPSLLPSALTTPLTPHLLTLLLTTPSHHSIPHPFYFIALAYFLIMNES